MNDKVDSILMICLAFGAASLGLIGVTFAVLQILKFITCGCSCV